MNMVDVRLLVLDNTNGFPSLRGRGHCTVIDGKLRALVHSEDTSVDLFSFVFVR